MFNCSFFIKNRLLFLQKIDGALIFFNDDYTTTMGFFYSTNTRQHLKIKKLSYVFVYKLCSLYRYYYLHSCIFFKKKLNSFLNLVLYRVNFNFSVYREYVLIMCKSILAFFKKPNFFFKKEVISFSGFIGVFNHSLFNVTSGNGIYNFSKYCSTILNSSSFLQGSSGVSSLSVLRYNLFFNKTKFSRNRQVVFSIVQFGLFINIIFILFGSSIYYQISPDLSYLNILVFFCAFTQINFWFSFFFITRRGLLKQLIEPIRNLFRLF